jgi:hypothetical protein
MGRFITDPIWWLYVFWLPSYLQEARGLSLQQVDNLRGCRFWPEASARSRAATRPAR